MLQACTQPLESGRSSPCRAVDRTVCLHTIVLEIYKIVCSYVLLVRFVDMAALPLSIPRSEDAAPSTAAPAVKLPLEKVSGQSQGSSPHAGPKHAVAGRRGAGVFD